LAVFFISIIIGEIPPKNEIQNKLKSDFGGFGLPEVREIFNKNRHISIFDFHSVAKILKGN
jgi:hypothetical protein